jgi:hypothetical protein
MTNTHQEQYTSERYEAQVDSYNSIVFRLDPTPVLESVKAKLMCKEWDESMQVYKRVPGLHPKMTEQGVAELMLELYARMSVDKALSNLDRNEINNIIRRCGDVIDLLMLCKADLYEVQEGGWDSIKYMTIDSIKIFLNRALNGRENELLAKQFVQKENINRSGTAMEAAPQAPRGIFSR